MRSSKARSCVFCIDVKDPIPLHEKRVGLLLLSWTKIPLYLIVSLCSAPLGYHPLHQKLYFQTQAFKMRNISVTKNTEIALKNTKVLLLFFLFTLQVLNLYDLWF